MTSVEENAKRLVDAAKRGELPIIKELSELANCIEFIDLPVNGMTALHYASCGKPLLVSALLKMGASLEMRDNDGFTALLHASSMDGSVECLNLLLEAGANPNVECNMNKTGLFYCQGSQAKFDLLTQAQIKVSSPSSRRISNRVPTPGCSDKTQSEKTKSSMCIVS